MNINSITYDHKTFLLKKKVSIPYYADYINSEANPLIGFLPNTRLVVYCYRKNDILKKALKEDEENT